MPKLGRKEISVSLHLYITRKQGHTMKGIPVVQSCVEVDSWQAGCLILRTRCIFDLQRKPWLCGTHNVQLSHVQFNVLLRATHNLLVYLTHHSAYIYYRFLQCRSFSFTENRLNKVNRLPIRYFPIKSGSWDWKISVNFMRARDDINFPSNMSYEQSAQYYH